MALLCGFVSVSGSVQARVADRPIQETEAQRLDAVRALISREKYHRFSSYEVPEYKATFCKNTLNDLLKNKGFTAIEPLATLNFYYPDWETNLPDDIKKQNEKTAEMKLGSTAFNDIKRCSSAEANGDLEKGKVLFNGFTPFVGDPPYRVYQLPASENPFKESKLIYWSEFNEKLARGREGYSWVNLDVCEHTHGLTIAYSDSIQIKNDPQGRVEALTKYRGKIVAWSVSRNFDFQAHSIDPKYKNLTASQIICRWSTYPTTSIEK